MDPGIGVCIVVGLIIFAVQMIMAGHQSIDPFCTTCGRRDNSRTRTRGRLAIEVLLWLCFIVPGLIYSIRRLSNRSEVCPNCGSATLVPFDSPAARKMCRHVDVP
jgi:hypothetical protein